MKKLSFLLLSLLLMAALVLPASAEEPPAGGEGGDPPPEPPACTHEYNAGVVTVSPTCGQAGTKTLTCTKCGNTKTESIPAEGSHTWNGGTVSKAPTCQAEGVRTLTCTVCNGTRTESIPVDPSAHSFGAWSAGQAGSHTRTCGCGASESAAHSFDVTATVPATCKEEGATAYGCSACGRIEYEILPKLTTHTYSNDCDPDCNVCGFTRDAAHTFSKVWTKKALGHWHACIKCGEPDEIRNHFAGPAATEDKDQICLTCGYLLTPKLGHTHDYETTLTSDETGHWHACTGCEDQKDFEEHIYDNTCDSDCNVCGYVTDTAHTADGDWNSDETGHWRICSACGEFFQYGEHIPGEGTAAQLCSVCGFALAATEETHVHEGGETWLSDENFHWKECSCGEPVEKAAHLWEENGAQKKAFCSVCGAEKALEESAPQGGISLGVILMILIGIVLIAAVVCVLLLFPKKSSGKYSR